MRRIDWLCGLLLWGLQGCASKPASSVVRTPANWYDTAIQQWGEPPKKVNAESLKQVHEFLQQFSSSYEERYWLQHQVALWPAESVRQSMVMKEAMHWVAAAGHEFEQDERRVRICDTEVRTDAYYIVLDCNRSHDLAALQQMTHLRTLEITYADIETMEKIEKLGPGSMVQRLALHPKIMAIPKLQSYTHLKHLYIDLSISHLPSIELIPKVPQVTHLSLEASNKLYNLNGLEKWPNLRHFALHGTHVPFTDVQALQQMPALRYLKLNLLGSRVKDLTPLASLKGLSALSLQLHPSIDNVDFLASLPALQQLSLQAHHDLKSIEVLGKLVALQHVQLWLEASRVESLPDFANNSNLQSLDLRVSPAMKSLQNLKQLPQLQALRLRLDAAHSKLPQLADLQNLRTLSLQATNQMDYQSLRQLRNLEALELSLVGAQQGSLSFVQQLQQLRWLQIQYQDPKQIDLQPLGGLSQLRYLQLKAATKQQQQSSEQLVQGFGQLAKLTQLEECSLEIPLAKASDVQALGSLTKLRQLSLYVLGNDIKSLAPLGQLQQLRNLRLFILQAPIENLTGLESLKKLRDLQLELYHSPLTQLQALAAMPALQRVSLGLGGTKLSNIQVLSQLKDVRELSLNMQQSQVKDITPIGSLKRLYRLTLGLSPQVETLSGLETLTQLKSLRVYSLNSKLQQLGNLDKLTNLTFLQLYVQQTQLQDISVLQKLPSHVNIDLQTKNQQLLQQWQKIRNSAVVK